jgi:hypothetical protein
MKNLIKIVIPCILSCVFFASCKDAPRSFPAVKDISEFKNTAFVPTMEDSLDLSKNVIYCSTFLYAWAEIKKALDPLTISYNYTDLQRLNNSTSYQHSLQPNDMETTALIEEKRITATAAFRKSLPFAFKLQRTPQPQNFKEEPVEFFGFDGDLKDLNLISEIVFYKNDSNFAIRLIPKDKDHEIILYCPPNNAFITFKEILDALNNNIKSPDQKKELNVYKHGDWVQIPVLSFNIKKSYGKFIGNLFMAKANDYIIDTAVQRTAFILDELGAEIESESKISVEVTSVPIKNSKRMRFNKPFLVMLKRKDSENPYFMTWINNTELMTKNIH